MAKTALNQLQEQLDAIRREAYEAGYAAAMQAIRDLTARSAPGGAMGGATGGATASPRPQRRGRRAATTPAETPSQPARQRQPRGTGRTSNRAASQTATRGAGRSGGRPQRGNNARMIEEILQASAPRSLRPAEIRTALQREKGVAMAFTSIRHALGQLEARKSVEQMADSKTWRYSGSEGAQG
ncbi:MAG: hypothetical protein JO001_02410 [Alphaproteobacteria bacterium]|nr:hypothetical protein [Alphaproteobacteria bacterium]